MSAGANCDLDGMYKLYGEAVPILDMPMRQQGGAVCKPCTQDLMLDDAENPRQDGGKFDSMFGGYLSSVAEKLKLDTATKTNTQKGGGGGVGYSLMPENYIAGQAEVRAFGKNMDPVPLENGGLYFPKCGEPLCVGASGQYGGSNKKSHSKSKRIGKMRMSKSRRSATRKSKKSKKCMGRRCTDAKCTCPKCLKALECKGVRCTDPNCKCKKCKHIKMSMRRVTSKHVMHGGAATADFRALGSSEQQPYPFDGETSILEVNPTLKGRDFSCRQPNWGPQCI